MRVGSPVPNADTPSTQNRNPNTDADQAIKVDDIIASLAKPMPLMLKKLDGKSASPNAPSSDGNADPTQDHHATTPGDLATSKPNPALQHLQTLQDDFGKFDTALQNDASKADHIVSKDDLQTVAADRSNRFSQADRDTAQFLLDHSAPFTRLDMAAASDNREGVDESADGKIGQLDAQAGLRDARDFDGAKTFLTQRPAIPADHPNQAQQDAELMVHLESIPSGAMPEPGVANRTFTQLLAQHQGDASYLHDFFGALGARCAGRALFEAFRTEGGDSRTQARSAIATLQQHGLLRDKELAAAQFKTTPEATSSFPLKTLLDAD